MVRRGDLPASGVAPLLATARSRRAHATSEYRNSAWYQAFVVYVPTLLIGTAPWFRPAWRIVAGVRRLCSRAGWDDLKAHDPGGLFLLLWFAVPLACFMVARARLPLYVVPLWAPLSLALARAMAGVRAPRERRRFHALLAGWCALLLGLKLASTFVPSAQDTGVLAESIKRSGARFNEIVDVGAKPHYGSALYLGVNVERVHLDPTGSLRGAESAEFLGQELASDTSTDRLLVVRARDMQVFTEICAAHGFTVAARGDQEKCRFVQIFRGSD